MRLGIDALLRAGLLLAFDQMGHGDGVVVGDANFPARTLAPHLIDVVGDDAPTTLAAVLSLFPVDLDEPVDLMRCPAGRQEVQEQLTRFLPRSAGMRELERFAFYSAASRSALILLTGERHGYGNTIPDKGAL